MCKHRNVEALFRSTLANTRRVLGNEHRDTLISIGGLASSLQGLGRLDECEPLMREDLETSRRVFDSDHPDTMIAIGNFDEAEPLYREALATNRRIHLVNHPDVLLVAHNMGALLGDMRRCPDVLGTVAEGCLS